MKSWKTTVLGIMSILTAVFVALTAMLDADPSTVPDWSIVVAAGTAGIGMILARDNDKTSECVSRRLPEESGRSTYRFPGSPHANRSHGRALLQSSRA